MSGRKGNKKSRPIYRRKGGNPATPQRDKLSLLAGATDYVDDLTRSHLTTADPKRRSSEVDEDSQFEADLDYLLDKNAELYRRLAR